MKKITNKKFAMISTENALIILAVIVVLFVAAGVVHAGVKAVSTTIKLNNITKENNQKAETPNYEMNYSEPKANHPNF